jgi:hypothetical protein
MSAPKIKTNITNLIHLFSTDPSLNDWLVTPTSQKTTLIEYGKSQPYTHFTVYQVRINHIARLKNLVFKSE